MKRPIHQEPDCPAPIRHRAPITVPKVGRRALLGTGAGAALAPFLPVLESRAQDEGPPKRILFVFQANGVIQDEWKPDGAEENFTFRRILQPLEAHKQDLLIISGMELKPEPKPPHSGHPQLFSNIPADLNRFRLLPGVTLDQYISQQRGDETRFGTLELGIVPYGGDDFYTREILFRGEYDPVPWEPSPYAAFERLFSIVDNSEMVRLAQKRQSILDGVRRDLEVLGSQLGQVDKALLEGHQESIRALEREVLAAQLACDAPDMGEPLDFKSMANFREMGVLQTDLMLKAFACDATRIGTLIWSGPTSTQNFPWLGDFGKNHHLLSHDSGAREPLIQINTWYSEQHAILLDKLKSIPEADGSTLFDNTVVFIASPLGDGNAHRKTDLPFIVAGGKWHFRSGRYLDFDEGPHGQLLVSLAHAMGVDIQTFGQPEFSDGPAPGLAI